MKKVGILAVLALTLGLLFAGISFADQIRKTADDQVISPAFGSVETSQAGMMTDSESLAAIDQIQKTADDQVRTPTFASDSSRKLTEHYGQSPMWGEVNEAMQHNELRESP